MKKWLVVLLACSIMIVSGCSRTPITSQSTGIWDHGLVYPISFVITSISHLFHDNYGMGIIAITLLIRFALYPLVVMIHDNQVKMQLVQPELKQLRAQQKDSQQFNKDMMQLYQKHGINPAVGCLPAIVQMFILMALYNAIVRTKAIASHTFLWFGLGQPDGWHLLPILAAIATFFQYWIMNYHRTSDENTMNQQMKMMMFMMPVMIFFMSYRLAAAIGLYWVIGNTFMALQTLYLERRKKKKINQTI